MIPSSRPAVLKLAAAGLCALALSLLPGDDASAQSIGIEAGATTVETFDGARPTLGISLFLPLTERLRLAGTGTQWTGCPDDGCDEPRSGHGNRGLNVLGLFTAVDGDRTDLSLGAGMGWYEMKRPDGSDDSESFYDEAFTFAVELRRAVAYNSGMYLRGETSFPTEDGGSRWSSLRLGVDVRMF